VDRAELGEHLAEVDATVPYYELLILDPTDDCAWFACNLCGRDVSADNQGCPGHAPHDVPGLNRAECWANPPHAPVWTLDGEQNGYGNPCPQCMYDGVAADLARANRCRHWPWRRWRATGWLVRKAYTLGVISGSGSMWGSGEYDHKWCVQGLRRRGRRRYILGVSRETWRRWLVGHHRRGEEVGFGFCGKCLPWPCCGSQRVEHAQGCTQESRDTAIRHAIDTAVAS
jgi:hypothetical protein